VFFRSLASFLNAGVTLHHAITKTGEQCSNRIMARICEHLTVAVQAGHKLSEAMLQFPRAFPRHIVGVVAAGELGGFLPVIIGDLALDYEIAQRASTRLRRWVIWLGWINAIGTFCLAPALPIIAPKLMEQGFRGISAGVIAWLIWTTKYVVVPFVLLLLAYFILKAVISTPSIREFWDSFALRIPWIGQAKRERSLASFARVLSRLLNAGVLPVQAWEAACNVSENLAMARRLREQGAILRSGGSLTQAMAAAGCITKDDERTLLVGEQSGQVGDALKRISAYYEDAALNSAGRAERAAVHFVITVNIIALAVAFYCIEGLTTLKVLSTFENM